MAARCLMANEQYSGVDVVHGRFTEGSDSVLWSKCAIIAHLSELINGTLIYS